eukprot:3810999-Rhodomonas_salina.1
MPSRREAAHSMCSGGERVTWDGEGESRGVGSRGSGGAGHEGGERGLGGGGGAAGGAPPPPASAARPLPDRHPLPLSLPLSLSLLPCLLYTSDAADDM